MNEAKRIREWADGERVPGTPYRVVAQIGAGGMGCVYEVEHVELGRRFVLKSLLATLSSREDLIARMRTEWRALGRLSHENIVDVVNAGVTPAGAPYYVMERLVGEPLSARLRRRRRLPIAEAAAIAKGILRGLSAAHAIGVIHRDIKPGNVFLLQSGGVKVLDFGIAKVLGDPSARTTGRGLAIGTPRYMSPEQASGALAEARSDVYAVGLVLFEMIAGRGPFDDARDPAAQMLAHLERKAPSLGTVVKDVPAALVELVARALAKTPGDRPTTAGAMALALEPFAAGADLAAAFATPVRVDDATTPDVASVWTDVRVGAEGDAPSSIPVELALSATEPVASLAEPVGRDRTTRTAARREPRAVAAAEHGAWPRVGGAAGQGVALVALAAGAASVAAWIVTREPAKVLAAAAVEPPAARATATLPSAVGAAAVPVPTPPRADEVRDVTPTITTAHAAPSAVPSARSPARAAPLAATSAMRPRAQPAARAKPRDPVDDLPPSGL